MTVGQCNDPPPVSRNHKGIFSFWGHGFSLVSLICNLGDPLGVVGIKKMGVDKRAYLRAT